MTAKFEHSEGQFEKQHDCCQQNKFSYAKSNETTFVE